MPCHLRRHLRTHGEWHRLGRQVESLWVFRGFQFSRTTGGMAEQELDAAAGTFIDVTAFTEPAPLPSCKSGPALGCFPTGLVAVKNKFMYYSSSDGSLFGYTIDPKTGSLTPLNTPSYTVAGGNSIAVNAAGTMLFVGDTSTLQISVFSVNADGSLTAATGNPFAAGVSPAVMATDGQSKFLYASGGKGATQVAALSIGSGGALTAVLGSPFAFPMAVIAGEPSGKFLLGGSRQSGDNHVYVFAIGSTGALTQSATVNTTYTPRNLSVHPNGKWVYSLNQDPLLAKVEPIEGFNFDSTAGTLTEMSASPFTSLLADGGPIEASGQFMFALGIQSTGTSNSIVAAVAISQTNGALTSTLSPSGFPSVDSAAYAVSDGQ